MANYQIYYHDAFKAEAIKDGWSWPAFFFNWIWRYLLASAINFSLNVFIF